MNPRPKRSYGPGSIKAGRKTKRGTPLILVYTDAAGRRRETSFYGTKRAARLELSRIVTERDLLLSGRGAEYTPQMPFEDLVDRYMIEMEARNGSDHAKATKKALLQVQGRLALRVVDDVRLSAVMAYRHRRLAETPRPANRTINLELGRLRAILNWAVQTSLLSSSPLAGYRQLPEGRGHKAVKRSLTEEELKRLLVAARELDAAQPKRFPLELVLLGLLLTGARYGAFRQLTRGSWSPAEKLLTIQDDTVKTGQGRQLKADAGQGGGLDAVIQASLDAGARITGRLPRSTDPIWFWGKGYRLRKETGAVNRELYKAMALAELEKKTAQGSFSVHAFRHTYVTRCARFGVPENRAAYWVGHSSVVMTRGVYTHIQAADLQVAATGTIPPLFPDKTGIVLSNRTQKEKA